MAVDLYNHQIDAIEKLRSGSILCGGVGSGKSRTALAYYFLKECEGKIKINGQGGYSPMKKPKALYIITTARKRDELDWERECIPFLIEGVLVDSWNNIMKYKTVKDAFFIFDESRVCGSGSWVKSFLKITQQNKWVLLSATPGDTWMDYIPVFVANGFYKNRTEFLRRHVVYNNFSKFPKIDHYVEVGKLIRLRDEVIVHMRFRRNTISHDQIIITDFNRDLFNAVMIKRWNPYEEKPIKDVGELCYLMRRVVNTDPSRLEAIFDLMRKHSKLIIFLYFCYEK